MKILNLYAGIGGNRKLWGDEHEITAVELNPKIAECYKKFFPNDNVIVDDAHEYLIKHFREFDFIWASPPCVSHSSLNFYNWNIPDRLRYPDMSLYQEILLLQHFFKGKWVIENVKPYYKPLIEPTFTIDRHCFWSSDFILNPQIKNNYEHIRNNVSAMAKQYDINLEVLKSFKVDCRKALRNMVVPEIGKYIFEQIIKLDHTPIINGVDVSKCTWYSTKEYIQTYSGYEEIPDFCSKYPNLICEKNPNCEYKQMNKEN